ncbi:MAG: hypothetical protein HRT88_02440 [Lentisphaeraceae bacterium]|nr:hypothetical protein [Lentisphaeraceae bacterium]
MKHQKLLESFKGYESMLDKITQMKQCGMSEFMVKAEVDKFIKENFSKLTHEEKMSFADKML